MWGNKCIRTLPQLVRAYTDPAFLEGSLVISIKKRVNRFISFDLAVTILGSVLGICSMQTFIPHKRVYNCFFFFFGVIYNSVIFEIIQVTISRALGYIIKWNTFTFLERGQSICTDVTDVKGYSRYIKWQKANCITVFYVNDYLYFC